MKRYSINLAKTKKEYCGPLGCYENIDELNETQNGRVLWIFLTSEPILYVVDGSRIQQGLHNSSLYQGGQVQVPSHWCLGPSADK